MSSRNLTRDSQGDKDPQVAPSADQDDLLPVALELWEKAGAQHWFPVEGKSMFPLLRKGDTILVNCGRDQVQRGSVVLFSQKGRLIAHRVWRITNDKGSLILVTKGDSRGTFDAPLPEERIIGRVVAVERGGRQRRLDSMGWQVAGWLIATATLCAAIPYRWGRAFVRRIGHCRRPQLWQ